MRNSASILCFLSLAIAITSRAQTVCATANENGVLTITAPAGYKFTTVNFASYGTPNGGCGAFTIGSCHSASSLSVCEAAIIGKNTASIGANNGVFGDPCVGTVKRLYVQAAYSVILPLKLVGFRCEKMDAQHVRLNWQTQEEEDTKEFVVEESTDGISFYTDGRVTAIGKGGKKYVFVATATADPVRYFRLKMIDIDGLFKYSPIIRLAGVEKGTGVAYDVSGAVYVTSNDLQEAALFNANGQYIKRITLKPGTQLLRTDGLHKGLFFLRTSSGVLKFIRR